MSLRFIALYVALCCVLLSSACSQKRERIQHARTFMKEWNYDRALTEIISYREARDAEIQYLLGYCYLKKNEYDEAAAYFKKSLARNDTFKDSIIALYNLHAQNAIRINELELALFLYNEIAALIPDYKEANNLFLVGDLNFEKGHYPAAAEAYTKALVIDSTSATALDAKPRLISALKESNNLERALRLARAEYERLKTSANLYQLGDIEYTIGVKLFDAGQNDSAQIFFEDIIASQEPKSLLDDAYYYIGEIQFMRNNMEAALEAYKKVLRLNPYEKGDIVKKAKARIQEIKERS